MRVFSGPEELTAAVGEEIGVSDWLEITQERVDLFAEATGDHQWIHTDPEAAAEGPFGTTIAHGYLTLSLLPSFMFSLVKVEGIAMGVNYGLNKVRFPRPVPVGARVRAVGELTDVKGTPAGYLSNLKMTIEIEGEDKPAAVADWITRLVFS